MNDAPRLDAELKQKPRLIRHRTNMVCCFTPLMGATLLHVAAEYGHVDVAHVLIEHGANVNARAAKDPHGLNGHTPLFHTVNSNRNRSRPVMDLLLDAGAKTDARVDGITWGHSFEWETVFFDLTPIAYAQLGMLPQVHRNELEITDNVKRLLTAAGRAVPPLTNVPNKYLVRG